MQYQGNRKILMWIAAGVVIMIILISLLVTKIDNKNTPSVYKDPQTGQQITYLPGKGNDSVGAPLNPPVYFGFDSLIKNGATSAQLSYIKSAFIIYSQSLKDPIDEVSVDISNITYLYDKNDPNAKASLNFKVKLNRTVDYQAKVIYSNANNAQLLLTDMTSAKTVFDSGVLGETD